MIKILLSVSTNNDNHGNIASTQLKQSNHNKQSLPIPIVSKHHNTKELRKRMKNRCVDRYMKWMVNEDDAKCRCDHEVPTANELIDLKKQNTVCALSGIPGTWNHTDEEMFNLTIDHKIPISKKGPFTRDNLQATIKPINNLKGNESDFEVSRYLVGLKKNHRHKCCCCEKDKISFRNQKINLI